MRKKKLTRDGYFVSPVSLVTLVNPESPVTPVYLTPAEGDRPWSVCSLLDERFVELPARSAVYGGPALLAVVLNMANGYNLKLSRTKELMQFETHLHGLTSYYSLE